MVFFYSFLDTLTKACDGHFSTKNALFGQSPQRTPNGYSPTATKC